MLLLKTAIEMMYMHTKLQKSINERIIDKTLQKTSDENIKCIQDGTQVYICTIYSMQEYLKERNQHILNRNKLVEI